MTKSRFAKPRFAIVAALAALTLAGCGSAEQSEPSAAAPTSVTTAQAIARSTPVSFDIPSIKAAGSLISVGLTGDGAVQVPADYRQAGWYQLGPAPGEEGSAVLLGHVDNVAGPGVFIDLKNLKSGDTIDVKRADGKTAHFAVTDVKTVSKDQFSYPEVFGPRGGSTLQLVTCGGQFDPTAKRYLSNVVVYSSLVSTT